MRQRRLRIIAGPNGSGKSSFKRNYLDKHPHWLGVYINPDDIEREIVDQRQLDLGRFKVKSDKARILDFLGKASQIVNNGLLDQVLKLDFKKNVLIFDEVKLNSYFVSALADFLHLSLVDAGTSFTFETVMSYAGKIELLKKAKSLSFRTYLYYLCPDNPEICVDRVALRVKQGGHDVPTEKIVDRYYRSLDNLLPAIRATDRAFIFNNASAGGAAWVAEVTNGSEIETKTQDIPAWFVKYVLDKLTQPK
jgi:predicted ABC-type ATPase